MVARPMQLITNAGITTLVRTNIHTIHVAIFRSQDIVCDNEMLNNFCFLPVQKND